MRIKPSQQILRQPYRGKRPANHIFHPAAGPAMITALTSASLDFHPDLPFDMVLRLFLT